MHEPHIYVTIIYTKVSHGDVSCCGIRADIAHLWHRQVLVLFHLLEIGLLLCVTGILLSLQFKLMFVLPECFGVLHILDWLVPQEVGRKVSPYGAVELCASLGHALPRREGVREREGPGNGRKAHLIRIRCLAISDDVANYGGQVELFGSTPLVASVLANLTALLFFLGRGRGLPSCSWHRAP